MSARFFGVAYGVPGSPALLLLAAVLYGFMANLCYTGGWVTELLVRRLWPQEANAFARISFTMGLIFSALLTLSVGFLVGAAALVAFTARVLRSVVF